MRSACLAPSSASRCSVYSRSSSRFLSSRICWRRSASSTRANISSAPRRPPSPSPSSAPVTSTTPCCPPPHSASCSMLPHPHQHLSLNEVPMLLLSPLPPPLEQEHCNILQHTLQCVAVWCSMVQYVAVCCSVLRYVASRTRAPDAVAAQRACPPPDNLSVLFLSTSSQPPVSPIIVCSLSISCFLCFYSCFCLVSSRS